MNVLIAEDDVFIREGLKDLLEAEGYTCILAEDGEVALRIFNPQAVDLVLLDIMMPKKDGYSVCREIRRQDEDIPVIFITAKSEEIDQVLGLELGADDYIMKPFGTREVVARIRAVTRRSIKQRCASKAENCEVDNRFVMGDLEITPDELRAQRKSAGGELVTMELSLRDINILRLLADNPGKVISRDEVFNACWGRDYLPSSRTLDQHISKLRKVVEIDSKAPKIISTVHGVGYRFEG
ncbi:MAG: DNA-binding response regulator [Alteromonadaceae bacterium]|nr:MAG: DNA-binding response regulator [Alteromonadaceae bacterium]